METKKEKTKVNKKGKMVKRQVSIITVFLWIFLIATMITMVGKNFKNSEFIGEINKLEEQSTKSNDVIRGKDIIIYPYTSLSSDSILQGLVKDFGKINKKVGEIVSYNRLPIMSSRC